MNQRSHSALTFSSIQEIRDYAWIGNHHNDSPAFRAVDAFVHDESHTTSERAEAIRIQTTRGLGMTASDAPELNLLDDALVSVYLAQV